MSDSPKQSYTPEAVTIEVRHPDFPFDKDIPRYWYKGDPLITHYHNAQSLSFPEGERFFIDSVMHFRSRLEDPELIDQVMRFTRQEAAHTGAHKKYNAWLKDQGYDVDKYEAYLAKEMTKYRDRLSPLNQLAATVCMEHFTAVAAMQGLADSDKRETDMAEPFAALWEWHSMEEAEHKSVAFDVYRAVGGGYWRRVWMMLVITLTFWPENMVVTGWLLKQDGKLSSLSTWWRGFRRLYTLRNLLRFWKAWFAFFRPGFHPWDYDNIQQIVEVRERYSAS